MMSIMKRLDRMLGSATLDRGATLSETDSPSEDCRFMEFKKTLERELASVHLLAPCFTAFVLGRGGLKGRPVFRNSKVD